MSSFSASWPEDSGTLLPRRDASFPLGITATWQRNHFLNMVTKCSTWSELLLGIRFRTTKGYLPVSCYGNERLSPDALQSHSRELPVCPWVWTHWCFSSSVFVSSSHGAAEEAEATVQRERGGQEAQAAESLERGWLVLIGLICSLWWCCHWCFVVWVFLHLCSASCGPLTPESTWVYPGFFF